MLPAIERITLLGLYQYRKAQGRAQHKYKAYTTARDSVNRIIEILERTETCRRPARDLFLLNNEVRAAQRGYADSTGVLANDDLDVSKDSVAQRMLAKSLGRPLLQKYHPDQNGDLIQFQYVLDAVRRGDVALLQFLSSALHSRNLTWQCTDGIEHMNSIASVYESRFSKIRSNPLNAIARKYIQGKRQQAEADLREFLQARILERRTELHNILTRSIK